MTTPPKANREYKNSVFTLLFGDIVLELYGAIVGKTFPPDTKVQIATLTDALIRGRLNDLAFIVEDRLVVLIEHQSSVNQNMPQRMLLYVAKIYEWYIETIIGPRAIYGEKMQPIPRPEFIVLYNGVKELPNGEDKQTLRLSDMFAEHGIANPMGGLELEVEVFNINKGRNPDMAARCPELDGYETFIQMVRDNEKTGMTKEEAIQKAVLDCIDNDVLKNFLETYKKELVNMLVKEWDFDLEKKVAWEEGREEGIEEGIERGIEEATRKNAKAMKDNGVDLNTIAAITGLPVSEISRM